MSKVVLFAASLLLVAGIATAGIINPCNSPVVFNGSQPECYAACPQGDTKSLLNEGFYLSFTIRDLGGLPVEGVPGTDFWLIDCDPARDMTLCAGSASSGADSATNAAGKTTMSLTTLSVGNCANGISPVCQGYVLGTGPAPCPAYCFNVKVRSFDVTGDLLLNINDLSKFATAYPPYPPGFYQECSDFNCDTVVNIQDLAQFAFHYGPPGHKCV